MFYALNIENMDTASFALIIEHDLYKGFWVQATALPQAKITVLTMAMYEHYKPPYFSNRIY